VVKVSCAGIHLSGPNASKTAVVILRASVDTGVSGLELVRVYEKIGSFGNLFSDERLVSILSAEGPFKEVFVDCPLTSPPCVDCTRPACPGAVRCDDVGVAFMLALASKKSTRGKRKCRPVNPQSQRLWDVVQGMSPDQTGRPFSEPTYSSNLAPLVVRARTLQRRLNSLGADSIILRETSVPAALNSLSRIFPGHDPATAHPPAGTAFRSFENGRSLRRQFVNAILRSGLLLRPENMTAAFPFGGEDVVEALSGSVEVFQALVTAIVAACHSRQMTSLPLPGFEQAGGGWVHLPELGILAKNI
jgi:hypothetical protein